MIDRKQAVADAMQRNVVRRNLNAMLRDTGLEYRTHEGQNAKVGCIPEYESSALLALTFGNGDKLYLADTTSGDVTVTLPDAADSMGFHYSVKKTVAANSVNVVALSGTIDGTATHSIATQYNCFRYTSDGSNYWIVAHYA